MKIVINSHIKSTIALNHLIESMKLYEDYNNFEIIIAIGGYYTLNEYEIKKDKNITYIYCNHNSIDFTGLIALSELYSDNIEEYYLYLHDTCKVGQNLYTKLKNINLTNVSTIKINSSFSMNIGIYSQKIINTFRDFLLTYKNTDESLSLVFKERCISYEDHLFRNDPFNIVLENYNGWNYTGPTDYYNTGIMRIVEYYPNLDLYKIKANWGHGNIILLN